MAIVNAAREYFLTSSTNSKYCRSSPAVTGNGRRLTPGDGCERPHSTSGKTMANTDSRVTIHMAASLDGFIARKDGSVDWLETADEFAGGETLDPGVVEGFLKTIDCHRMGSRTYER